MVVGAGGYLADSISVQWRHCSHFWRRKPLAAVGSKNDKWQGAFNSGQLHHQDCLMATASRLTVGAVAASQQLFLTKPPDRSLLPRTTTESNN